MDWGKGAEVYLFCTGKERIQELRKRVTSRCGRRVVSLNIILKSFLKSLHATEAAWSWSLENYDSFEKS